MSRKKILFVCLGNICRSPLAEGIFIHLCRERGVEKSYVVDSAGTGDWHVGQPPDTRALAAAKRQGVHLPSICRQVDKTDFAEHDLILAMDNNNLRALLALCPPEERGKIRLMRSFDAADRDEDVPDPYYGDARGFDEVFALLHRCCGRLLDELEAGRDGNDGGTRP
jgi:protein-tyrosine phosphatase